MKTLHVTYDVQFRVEIEVDDGWQWDGTLDAILEHTTMPFNDPSGELVNWEVAP